MKIDYERLAEAARNLDAYAEEHGFEAAMAFAGLDPDEARRIAEQRALRMTLVMSGDLERLKELATVKEPQAVALNAEQERTMESLVVVYLDAMAVTMRGAAMPFAAALVNLWGIEGGECPHGVGEQDCPGEVMPMTGTPKPCVHNEIRPALRLAQEVA
jgi:hypothetical protein